MKQTFRLGTIRGIPFGIHWSVLVIMVLITDILARSVLPAADPAASTGTRWAVAAVAAALFLASLAAHELAHAFVARRHGVRVGSVTLWMLGGVAELADEPPNARADLRIAGVGPLTSAAAAAAFAGFAATGAALGVPATVIASLSWIAATNGLIAVFNLLPGAPLDGGRILRAVLWRRHGDKAGANRTAARAGRMLGGAMIVGGLVVVLLVSFLSGLWLALVGWFIAGSARAEERWTDLREAAEGLRATDIMAPHPDHGWSWQHAGTFIEGVALRSRQSVFLVVNVTGDPIGAVTVERLALVQPRDARVRLGDLSVPLPSERVVGPDVPVITLFHLPPVVGDLVAVVASDHRLLGIITTGDIQRMLRRNRLRAGTPTTA
ncbi:site-2 protease family protein [Spirillospora sp. NPDC048819]|uniref:site-2 protease family protein n=1 Tax=Spirillospora sp. NPDC048819 TaxID=3155268 RepID=UPI0034069674